MEGSQVRLSANATPTPVLRPFFSKIALLSCAVWSSALAELSSPIGAWVTFSPSTAAA